MTKQIILTYEGLEKLEKELEYLKTTKRKEIAETIKQATAFGDLSENAEYDEAKNEQAHVEMRIIQIEGLLKNAKIIDDDDVDTTAVSLGCKVKVSNLENNSEAEYTIVGSTEADPSEAKISDESPVGSALLGKQVGEVAEVEVPAGKMRFKIISITK